MICLLGSDCEVVIHSQYAYFLGVPLELLGLLYYGLIALLYGFFVAVPEIALPALIFGISGLTIAALLFSFYLTFIQAFLLRQWCTWCLLSAGLCSVIFLLTIFGSGFGFAPFLAINTQRIYLLYFLGVVLGVGAATIGDLLFIKFLKDFRVSEWEADVMRVLSQVTWAGLGLLVVTGIGLYIPYGSFLNNDPQFLLKSLIALVLVASNIFYNLWLMPHLVKVSLQKRHEHFPGELRGYRRWGFAFGAVSLISWYAMFFLEMLNFTATFGYLLVVYLAVIALGILASQLLEAKLS